MLRNKEENSMSVKSNGKIFLLKQLQNSEVVFVFFSKCTKMPYIECDETSFDDQVFVFRKEEEAEAALAGYLEKEISLHILKIPQEQFLKFYSSLYQMGVNAMVIDKGEHQVRIQLEELVKKPDYSQLKGNQKRVENPEFHLTMLYLMQILRSKKEVSLSPEVKELENEMFRNFRKGSYIVAIKNDKEVPLMKMSDEQMYQPIFTDIVDFAKFNGKEEFRPAVIEFENLKKVIVPQAVGIVINPLGVHVVVKKEQLQ